MCPTGNNSWKNSPSESALAVRLCKIWTWSGGNPQSIVSISFSDTSKSFQSTRDTAASDPREISGWATPKYYYFQAKDNSSSCSSIHPLMREIKVIVWPDILSKSFWGPKSCGGLHPSHIMTFPTKSPLMMRRWIHHQFLGIVYVTEQVNAFTLAGFCKLEIFGGASSKVGVRIL